MKFGHDFYRHRIPEWTPYYIDYNHVKKVFKLACRNAAQDGMEISLTGLTYSFPLLTSLIKLRYPRYAESESGKGGVFLP